MFLRLIDINGNLILVNTEKVVDFSLEKEKHSNELRPTIHLVDSSYVFIKESVSEISLLLQEAGKVL